MDKFNFVKDGVPRKLPPGFRFQPTDKEIVFQYLARKIFSCPLPASIIQEVTMSSSRPWNFPTGDSDQERYFFIKKANCENQNQNRNILPTRAGFWRAIGPQKRIVCSKMMPLVGIKKTLVFYEGKSVRIMRTDWIMHEYCISTLSGVKTPDSGAKKTISLFQGSLSPIGNWVLCHLFTKQRSAKQIIGCSPGLGTNYDSCSSSSSSSSSDSNSCDLTEVSSNIVTDDETN